jgi:AcrR family transcriptional regulator
VQISLHGYDGVRLRDIAGDAGVSIGLLQHYFPTREDLLSEAFEHHCDELTARWTSMSNHDADPWELFVELVERIALNPKIEERATIWIELAAAAARHETLRPPLERTYRAWRGLITEIVEEGIARGTFSPPLPVPAVADVLLAAIDGALVALAGRAGAMTGEKLKSLVLAVAYQAMGAHPETPRRDATTSGRTRASDV